MDALECPVCKAAAPIEGTLGTCPKCHARLKRAVWPPYATVIASPCPICGVIVAVNAHSCPGCGRPMSATATFWVPAACVVIFFGAIVGALAALFAVR